MGNMQSIRISYCKTDVQELRVIVRATHRNMADDLVEDLLRQMNLYSMMPHYVMKTLVASHWNLFNKKQGTLFRAHA
jgi:hypothetical protein